MPTNRENAQRYIDTLFREGLTVCNNDTIKEQVITAAEVFLDSLTTLRLEKKSDIAVCQYDAMYSLKEEVGNLYTLPKYDEQPVVAEDLLRYLISLKPENYVDHDILTKGMGGMASTLNGSGGGRRVVKKGNTMS